MARIAVFFGWQTVDKGLKRNRYTVLARGVKDYTVVYVVLTPYDGRQDDAGRGELVGCNGASHLLIVTPGPVPGGAATQLRSNRLIAGGLA